MQRDLTDSSSLRNIGIGFAHSLISINQSIVGFEKMLVNKDSLAKDLKDNVAVLAEPIQTVLRKNGYIEAYEMLKTLTRGKDVSLSDIHDFVKSINIPDEDKNNLLNLTPENYIGLASELVDFI